MKKLPLTLLVLVVLVGWSSGQLASTCPPDNINSVQATFDDVRQISSFGLGLFKNLKAQFPGRNVFFSPYSIWGALALAYLGAEGNTLAQLEGALRIGGKDKGYKVKRLLEIELAKITGVELNEANRVYLSNNLELDRCFRRREFGDIRETDFRNPVSVAQDINGFVSQETKGLIRELVTPSHVARALLVLINAVYFKGAWEDPFDRRFTKPADFFCSSQTLTPCGKVQMMSDSARYNYYDSPTLGVEVLELPYAKSTMSMLAILPKPGKTVDSVVDSLNMQTLGMIIKSLSKTSMILEFPRFRMEQSLEGELKAALGALGITELFSRNGNLSGFAKLLTRNAADIVHKAVVDVTEEGTEAAAATGVITPLSLPPRLSFNRPFVFMIVDKRLGLVFFTGIYRTPV